MLLESIYLNNETQVPLSFGNEPKSEANQNELTSFSQQAFQFNKSQFAGSCVKSVASNLAPMTSHMF